MARSQIANYLSSPITLIQTVNIERSFAIRCDTKIKIGNGAAGVINNPRESPPWTLSVPVPALPIKNPLLPRGHRSEVLWDFLHRISVDVHHTDRP